MNTEKYKIDSIIDWEYLHELTDNDSDLELELLDLFVSDASLRIVEIKNAIALNDFQSIAREAHQIKGSGSNIGAVQIQLAAEKLEQMTCASQTENMMQIIAEIEDEITNINSCLKHLDLDRQ